MKRLITLKDVNIIMAITAAVWNFIFFIVYGNTGFLLLLFASVIVFIFALYRRLKKS